MTIRKIRGYCDRPNVRPGETLDFFISSDSPGRCRARLARLIHGDRNPVGPGYREEEMPSVIDGGFDVGYQRTQVGGYVEVPDLDGRLAGINGFTLHVYVWPTLPQLRQGIVSRWCEKTHCGWALLIENGRLVLLVGDGKSETRIDCPALMFPETWYSVVARVDTQAKAASLSQVAKINSVNSRFGSVVDLDTDDAASVSLLAPPSCPNVPVIIGGLTEAESIERSWVTANYNGKIDAPRLFAAALSDGALVDLHSARYSATAAAHWDFAAGVTRKGIPTDLVQDVSGHEFHGRCVNQPDRGMTGWNWQGREENFVHCPEQYGALWFHSDSIDDARWTCTFTLAIPNDLQSGAYAVKLDMEESVDRIPFFVAPPRGSATATIAVVIPTFSYLAYANSQVMQNAALGQGVASTLTTLDGIDLDLAADPAYGRSTYDYHVDGRGVSYSSWRRPILNMRPDYRHEFGAVWQFPADLHLLDWLTRKDFKFDVVTDHDLQVEGAELLGRYAVVISPSHAEYCSWEILDAYEQYLSAGGRGMYLGANAFYWIASPHPEKPWMIEVRKGEMGDQAWRARPGELYHSTTGERGGLWRARARAPQKTWGTGYTAHGMDISAGYYQMPDSADARIGWIMEGINPQEILGNFGLINGGAAGLELDRIDYALGTPPNTMLLASSHGHSASTMLVPEEQYFAYPGATGRESPLVRADIVFFTTKKGGAVFSTSSMAWCGSLSHSNYSNNVSRMTENVLRRFAAPELIPEVI
jgi:N,N-dimethylformamidase